MKIGIPREVLEGETRVAVVPSMIAALKKSNHEVFIETGAGPHNSAVTAILTALRAHLAKAP